MIGGCSRTLIFPGFSILADALHSMATPAPSQHGTASKPTDSRSLRASNWETKRSLQTPGYDGNAGSAGDLISRRILNLAFNAEVLLKKRAENFDKNDAMPLSARTIRAAHPEDPWSPQDACAKGPHGRADRTGMRRRRAATTADDVHQPPFGNLLEQPGADLGYRVKTGVPHRRVVYLH